MTKNQFNNGKPTEAAHRIQSAPRDVVLGFDVPLGNSNHNIEKKPPDVAQAEVELAAAMKEFSELLPELLRANAKLSRRAIVLVKRMLVLMNICDEHLKN